MPDATATSSTQAGRRGKRAGSALMLTLWVTAALSVLLTTVFMQERGLSRVSIYQKDLVEADAWSFGGIQRLAAHLHARRGDKNARILGADLGVWRVFPPLAANDSVRLAQTRARLPDNAGQFSAAWDLVQVPDGGPAPTADDGFWITVQIEAEDAKLPLNFMQNDGDWTKVPNVTEPLARAITAEINAAPFTSLEEMLGRIQSLTPERYRGNREVPGFPLLLSAWSDGTVYLNRARPEVIRAMAGVDPDAANGIVARLERAKTRPEEYFQRLEDLQSVSGVTPAVYNVLKGKFSVMPIYYRLRATACVNGIISRREAVLFADRDGRRTKMVMQ